MKTAKALKPEDWPPIAAFYIDAKLHLRGAKPLNADLGVIALKSLDYPAPSTVGELKALVAILQDYLRDFEDETL